MIVTLIHGQNHKGSSYHIAASLTKLLKPEKTYEFFLPHDLPEFCTGCYACLEKGIACCPHEQHVSVIADAMAASELLVFTTPVYCMRCSGPMKNFLDHFFTDWMVHQPKEANFHKKAVIIATCAGAGANHAIKDIKTSLSYWGLSDIWSLSLSTAAMHWEDVISNKKEKIHRKIRRIANKIKGGEPHVYLWLKTRFLFMIMRRMHKKGMSASRFDIQYWQEKGWLNQSRPWKLK